MKINTTFLHTTLFCFLFALPSAATTLTELQQTALANRKIIQRYKTDLEKSEQTLKGAKSAYLPSVDVSYLMNNLDEGSLYESRQNSALSGAVRMNLFAGFRDRYTIESARLAQKAEALKVKGIEQDVLLNVALRYLAIYNQKATLQVAQDFHNTIAKVYEDAESRYNVGLINKSDLLKFKVDLDNAVINLKKAAVAEKKSVRLLQREIDAKIQADQLAFNEFDKLPEILSQEQYETEMLDNRSEIKVLQELIGAAEAQVRVAYASHYPTVDLSSSYLTSDDSLIMDNGGVNEEEFRTRLVLSMNLFDGYNKYSKVQTAKLEVQAIRYDLEELENDLQSELDNLFLDYAVSVDNVTVAESSIVQAEENLRVNRLTYQEGVSTESDLLDAITNLSRARFNFVAAKSAVFDTYFRITRTAEKF